MADTLIPGLAPVRESELGDTMFEEPGNLGVVDDETLLTLNMGPQHPSTHGVFRLIMQLDGETVVGVKPVMGYLHRSTEKLGEARTYVQGTVLTDRMDYLSPMTTNWAYALAIEKPGRPGSPRARRVHPRHRRRAEPHRRATRWRSAPSAWTSAPGSRRWSTRFREREDDPRPACAAPASG